MPLDLPIWANRLHFLNLLCHPYPKGFVYPLAPAGLFVLAGRVVWVVCFGFAVLTGLTRLFSLLLWCGFVLPHWVKFVFLLVLCMHLGCFYSCLTLYFSLYNLQSW